MMFLGYVVHRMKIQSPDYEARGRWPEPLFSPHLPPILRLQVTSTCHPDLPLLLPSTSGALYLQFSVNSSSVCSIAALLYWPFLTPLQHWWRPHLLGPDSLNAAKFSSGDAALSASFKSSDSKWFVSSKGNPLLWTWHLFLEGQVLRSHRTWVWKVSKWHFLANFC